MSFWESLWFLVLAPLMVGVILLLIEYYSGLFTKAAGMKPLRERLSPPTDMEPPQRKHSVPCRTELPQTEPPYPSDILDKLASVAPYQQHVVAETYSEQRVRWRLTFLDLTPLEPEGTVLQVHTSSLDRDSDGHPASVFFIADAADYPRLKVVDKGDPVYVEGEIAEVYPALIVLSDCKLRFQ